MMKQYCSPSAKIIELRNETMLAVSNGEVTYDVNNNKTDDWGASNRRIWDNDLDY